MNQHQPSQFKNTQVKNAQVKHTQSKQSQPKRSKHWLVIDDDLVFCRILKKSLITLNHSVMTANDTRTAMASVHQLTPDYIILDLNIGQESGIHLINPLLTVAPQAKILMLTGYASIATAVAAVKLGAHHYLSKPCGIDEIIKALDVSPDTDLSAPIDERLSLEHHEWEYIHQVLDECQGNISEAARVLKMHRRTLQRKLQKKRKIVIELD